MFWLDFRQPDSHLSGTLCVKAAVLLQPQTGSEAHGAQGLAGHPLPGHLLTLLQNLAPRPEAIKSPSFRQVPEAVLSLELQVIFSSLFISISKEDILFVYFLNVKNGDTFYTYFGLHCSSKNL